MDVIQSVWQRVSEDYASFDVNVTTEEPAPGVIERSSLSDNVFGTRAVVSADVGMQTTCGCGGVAYLGVFDFTGTSHANYQPAWVFTKGVGTGAKNITEALSHEVGHNLGLSHDGTATEGYYRGTAGWAPIMGVGYYEGLTQWSRGEYPNANNQENDYSVIANNGVSLRVDEDSNSSITARSLNSSLPGVISSPTDTDWYTFTPGSSGSATISGTVSPVSPNLDLRLDLYASSNLTTPLASSDPSMIDVSTDFVDGLNASITYSVVAGTTYFIKVDGVGFGSLYSDYGSLGGYTIQISGVNSTPFSISAASASPTSSTVPTTYSSSATQTTITLTRSGTGGANPTTTLTASGGTWSLAGANNVTLSSTSLTTGSITVTLLNTSGSFTLSLNQAAPVGIYTATLGTSLLTYSVDVGQVPNQVTGLTCQKDISKRNSGICSWSALTQMPTRYEYRSKPSTSTTWTNWTSTATNTSLTLNGLKSRVTYNVEVRAVNKYGPGSSAAANLVN
jgi:hypothetical protein